MLSDEDGYDSDENTISGSGHRAVAVGSGQRAVPSGSGYIAVPSGSRVIATGSEDPNLSHSMDIEIEDQSYEVDETPPSSKRKRGKVVI